MPSRLSVILLAALFCVGLAPAAANHEPIAGTCYALLDHRLNTSALEETYEGRTLCIDEDDRAIVEAMTCKAFLYFPLAFHLAAPPVNGSSLFLPLDEADYVTCNGASCADSCLSRGFHVPIGLGEPLTLRFQTSVELKSGYRFDGQPAGNCFLGHTDDDCLVDDPGLVNGCYFTSSSHRKVRCDWLYEHFLAGAEDPVRAEVRMPILALPYIAVDVATTVDHCLDEPDPVEACVGDPNVYLPPITD